MRTFLLLAGRSRRFWPLSEKALWPFLGHPLLAYQVERLQGGGLTNIMFVGGQHNIEEVHDLFPTVPSIEQEDPDLGMRGAILSALSSRGSGDSCPGESPICIVSNNDVIESEGYGALLAAGRQPGVDGAILAQRVKRYFPGGYLVTSPYPIPHTPYPDCPRIAGIVEKPGEGHEPSDLVNIVAHVHNRPEKLREALEETSSDRDDAYEVALTRLCKELNYVAVPYEGRWDAVKYPWHILDLTERFLSEVDGGVGQGQGPHFAPLRGASRGKRGRGQDVHPSAIIEGPVVIEEGVKVLPHATIQGPSYIGKNTIIGTGALVRDSIIGDNCVIGFASEVARSNLHSRVWTHSTYLGDSVVGRNAAFGAGTVAANFRLDAGGISSVVRPPSPSFGSGFGGADGERVNTRRTKLGVIVGNDVRAGIHVSFAPGVKVGSGSFINSATFVSRDVQDGKYVTVKEGVLEERENRAGVPGEHLPA